jgi:hypothetical protein
MVVEELALRDNQGNIRLVLKMDDKGGGAGLWLQDAAGKMRARLNVDDKGLPCLAFFSPNGTRQVNLVALENESSLALYDLRGALGATLYHDPTGAGVNLGLKGARRARFNVDEQGQPGLVYFWPNGNKQVNLVGTHNNSALEMFGLDGALAGHLTADPDRTLFMLHDRQGKERVVMNSDPKAWGLNLRGPQGNRAGLVAFPDQDTRLFLVNPEGWESIRLRAEKTGPLLQFQDRKEQPLLNLTVDGAGNSAMTDRGGKSLLVK